jgi:hypothetical protein
MRIVTNLHGEPLRCAPSPTQSKIGVKIGIAAGLLLCWSVAEAERSDDPVDNLPNAAPGPVYAQINYAKTILINGVYLLSSRAELSLPTLPELALKSGLPLVFMLKIEIERQRPWWFNEVVLQATVRVRLEYFELTRRYQVTRLSSGRSTFHTSLIAALQNVSTTHRFPLIQAVYIEEGGNYTGTLVLSLDADALPLPLRPQVYLSPEWNFASEEFRWVIQ